MAKAKRLSSSSKEFIGKNLFETELTPEQIAIIGEPIKDNIAVDGAWNTKNGLVEYQGSGLVEPPALM